MKTIQNPTGVILALGNTGLRNLVRSSPTMSAVPSFAAAASLPAIDVISCRLWLDRTVETRTVANVFASFPQLRGAGGTFFMLDQMQRRDILWEEGEAGGR